DETVAKYRLCDILFYNNETMACEFKSTLIFAMTSILRGWEIKTLPARVAFFIGGEIAGGIESKSKQSAGGRLSHHLDSHSRHRKTLPARVAFFIGGGGGNRIKIKTICQPLGWCFYLARDKWKTHICKFNYILLVFFIKIVYNDSWY
ncbi:MAG: hypothetical protein R3Y62_03675, partial [Eubacteriales bacterium]